MLNVRRGALGALLITVLLGSVLLWPRAPQAEPVPTPPTIPTPERCFAETGACIQGRFLAFWETHGGTPMFGLPLGPETIINGLTTQRFERARFELHPVAAPNDVQLARVGAEALARQDTAWQNLPPADGTAPDYFAQTGHAIDPEFADFWHNHGIELDNQPGLSSAESTALFGLPLTPARVVPNPSDGRPRLTQYFERARFELYPENPPDRRVLLGRVEAEAQRAPLPPPATPDAAPAAFVRAVGSNLLAGDQIIRLKGVNYYPQGRPWAEMWNQWDAPQMARELRQARDELGINTVRVLLPQRDSDGLEMTTITQLRELSQIAGDLDLKLIVSLFDFVDWFPAADTTDFAVQAEYATKLAGNFLGDDRIIAWELHNEPDQYPTWKRGDAPAVLDWLGRMADVLHKADPKHLVTVGMASYEHLLAVGPDGRRPVDYSDFISVHSYNAADLARQLSVVRAQTDKPMVLAEFGWPSGPRCAVKDYTEAEQLTAYRTALTAADNAGLAGVVAWQLRDTDAGPTRRWDTREEHYGLYRPDGSRKPAAEPFSAFAAAPLPSALRTNQELTSDGPNVPDGPQAPVLVDGSGFYIKGWFRRAYEVFGGRASFGLPLGEAFREQDTQRVVQYFEHAQLELHPEARDIPGFEALSEVEKLQLLVRPVALDVSLYAMQNDTTGDATVVDARFAQTYEQLNGAWRLGPPRSTARSENLNGTSVTVQYFANGRLEQVEDGQVQVGTLGAAAFHQRCSLLGQ